MSEGALPPVHILLVEDNAGDVLLIRRSLRDSLIQHQLTVARHGEEALDILHRRGAYADAVRPQLILLDLNLPRRSGLEVLEDVKRDPSLRTIPVIMLSSSSDSRDVMAAYERHTNAYVPKPADLTGYPTLIRAIEDFWLKLARLPEA